jgi:putative membrane protein
MNLLLSNLGKKIPHFIATMGFTSAIAMTGYAQINQGAIAQTTINQYTILETQTTRLSQMDMMYVQEASQAGIGELELANLALERSKNENIKQYARQMIQDYTGLNQELMELAQQKGMNLPTNLSPKYRALKTQLSKLSGVNFDQAYISEAGINGHMENLVMHTRQIQLGEDPDLQAFAAKNFPILETHLQLVEFILMSPENVF